MTESTSSHSLSLSLTHSRSVPLLNQLAPLALRPPRRGQGHRYLLVSTTHTPVTDSPVHAACLRAAWPGDPAQVRRWGYPETLAGPFCMTRPDDARFVYGFGQIRFHWNPYSEAR